LLVVNKGLLESIMDGTGGERQIETENKWELAMMTAYRLGGYLPRSGLLEPKGLYR